MSELEAERLQTQAWKDNFKKMRRERDTVEKDLTELREAVKWLKEHEMLNDDYLYNYEEGSDDERHAQVILNVLESK